MDDPMSHEPERVLLLRLHALLQDSVPLWGCEAVEVLEPVGQTLVLRCVNDTQITIAPTPEALRAVARWSVISSDGASRVCSSVLGVLAVLQQWLTPQALHALPPAATRVRLGVLGMA